MGAIIEKTARMPLDAFMNERIFQPLGMKETFGLHRGTDSRLKRCASRYRNQSGPLECVWKPSDGAQFKFMRGSQGLGSTPMDYARFLALWLDRGRVAGKRLLSAEAIARGLTPVSLADFNTGFPRAKVYIYGIFPIPMVVLGCVMIVFSLSGLLSGQNAGGEAAHLSGMASGP